MTYLCNPLLRGRLFIDWLFYFRWLSGVDVVRWGAEKNKKNKFCGVNKYSYLCNPKRKRGYPFRRREAAGYVRGVEK